MNILCLLGYGDFTNRINNSIHLLQKKNKDITCTAIVFGKHNYDFLKKQKKTKYNKIICVENLFENLEENFLKYKDLNKFLKKCKSLDTKYNINCTRLIYSERIFVNHAHFNIYRKKLTHSQISYIVYSIFTKIFNLVDKNQFDLIFVYTSASFISEILHKISVIKKIKFLTIGHSRFLNYYIPIFNNKEYPEKLFKFYKNNKRTPKKICSQLLNKYLKTIRGDNNILNRHNNLRTNRKTINLLNLLRFLKFFIFGSNSIHYLSPTRYQRLKKNIEFKFNEIFSKKYFKQNLPSTKYVYVPLATIPEASLLIRGVDFYDQLSLIKKISLNVPVDCKILVKDHPGMRGVTPINFYKELNNIFNVHLIRSNYSTYECIKNSEAVLVVSGTTGMQSMALGKKTIVLGKAVYSYLKSTFKPKKVEEIRKIININWTDSKILNQKKDFIKYINSVISTQNIIDKDGIYWNQGKVIQNTLDIDFGLCEILKKNLNYKDV